MGPCPKCEYTDKKKTKLCQKCIDKGEVLGHEDTVEDVSGEKGVENTRRNDAMDVEAKLQRQSAMKRDISTPCHTPVERTRSNRGEPTTSKARRVEEPVPFIPGFPSHLAAATAKAAAMPPDLVGGTSASSGGILSLQQKLQHQIPWILWQNWKI